MFLLSAFYLDNADNGSFEHFLLFVRGEETTDKDKGRSNMSFSTCKVTKVNYPNGRSRLNPSH